MARSIGRLPIGPLLGALPSDPIRDRIVACWNSDGVNQLLASRLSPGFLDRGSSCGAFGLHSGLAAAPRCARLVLGWYWSHLFSHWSLVDRKIRTGGRRAFGRQPALDSAVGPGWPQPRSFDHDHRRHLPDSRAPFEPQTLRLLRTRSRALIFSDGAVCADSDQKLPF